MARVDPSVIPEVQPQAAVTPRQQLATSPSMFGAGTGQGLEALGAGLSKEGEFWGEVQTDSQLNTAFDQTSKLAKEYQTLGGQEALDRRAEFENRIDAVFKETGDQLSSPKQRVAFESQARAFRYRYIDGMIGTHADQQGKLFTKAQNDATGAMGDDMIASNPNDQNAFALGLHFKMKGATRNAQLMGVAGDSTIMDNIARETAQNATETRIKALIVSPNLEDRQRAKGIFEANRGLLASSKNYDAFSTYIENRFNELKATEDAEGYLATASPLGDKTVPAPSVNNLGNVKTVAAAQSGAHEFQNPETPTDGVILAANNLRSGYRGLSLSQIAEKWAPREDGNDPAAWARNVSSASGIPVGTVPDLNNPDDLSKLMRGIAVAEKSPQQRVPFSDAVIREGVDAALSGRTPKLNKAAMLMDEASTLAKIDHDYSSDPVMGHKVAQIVRSRFAEARMASQAQALAAQDANEKLLREAGDMIRGNADFKLQPWLDAHPNLPEQQAEHLIKLQQDEMNSRLHGKPGDYGPKAADVLQRILNPARPDGIRHQEQLNAIAASGDLNPTGWQWASGMLAESKKEGAEGDREMMSTFYRDARSAVTMYDGTKDLLPGATEKWDRALPIINQALAEGRAKGIPLGQMLARDGGKDSVWKALGEPGGPFLPSTAQVVAGQINRDAQNAEPAFDIAKVRTVDELKAAYDKRQVSLDQARALVDQHPEWGIKFRNAPASGPKVPVQ